MEENVYVICCESLDIFKNKKEAEKFYKICSLSSEGAERERYMNVLVNIDNKLITDDSTIFCNKINIQTNDKKKFINYNVDFLPIKETINRYETILKPVLETSNEINDADELYLAITIRNKEYLINLK